MILEACLGCANGGMAPPAQAIGGAGEGGINCGGEQPMLMLLLQPAGLQGKRSCWYW